MLAFKLLSYCIRPRFLQIHKICRHFSKATISPPPAVPEHADDDIDEGPIKYTTSPASKWKAQYTRSAVTEPRLWYEPYVVIGSLAVLLIYFTMLREESDIDQELDRTLYSRIKGLEESQLVGMLQYNEKMGLETAKVRQRLKEIESEKIEKEK